MATETRYQLGEERIHHVLSNARRKQTLELLKKKGGQIELRTLAETIAETESGDSPPPKDLRRSVYNSLHQTHLPKLDRDNIIDYDRNRKVVTLRPKARRVDLYAEVLTPYGITWSTYYRTLSVLGFLAIIADRLDVLWFPNDYTVIIASVFLLIIALSTTYQLWSNNWIQIRRLLGD